MTENKKQGFMDKIKDKLKGGDDKEGHKTDEGTGEAKKHHGSFGERLKDDEDKFHEYNLKEERMEADDNIWGQGPK